MTTNYYAAMSRDTNVSTFENNFHKVCKVKFIKSAQFDSDIEQRLAVLLNSGMEPSLTDKEYYYRHDIIGLNCGDIVLVPARDTVTLAIVSSIGCEHRSDCFSSTNQTVLRSMKKVLGHFIISRALAERVRRAHRRVQLEQEREELRQKVRTTECQINASTQRRSRIAVEGKNAESRAKTLQDNLALYQGRLVAINRTLGE